MTSTGISTETSADTVTLERFRSAVSVLTELPTEAQAYRVLGETDLLELNRLFATSQRILRGSGALIAGEIAHRSTPELGSEGLAQRAGHRTPEQFIKITTGATARDAVTAVKVGELMREAALSGEVDSASGEVATPAQPWLAPVTVALLSRSISIEAADAIRVGLGSPNSAITALQLEDAATQLCEAALSLDPDALAREARAFRDELDIGGVALRDEERRQKRSLRLFLLPDGMTKLVWTMDPETAASVRDLYDRTTSPKLGGVRFVSADRQKLADQIQGDERTPEQLASDGFEQLLKLGADADPRFLLGSGAPVVRITATKTVVETRRGFARIEGQPAPVSVATLEKLTCESATKSVIFDESGRVLDFGREQRFFTRRQREALALVWGGCAAPGCDRPPSWCEAHHIVFWARDKGGTDLADGILLCRHHHLLFHNNGWEIQRDASGKYWLIPPARQDPAQTPILLSSKGRAASDLRRERATP
ncbi:MAG: hypothetical protein QOH77_797 [Actinomycetota bacterium]|nr:hypothetical protein [Actinomycetota bacterium]